EAEPHHPARRLLADREQARRLHDVDGAVAQTGQVAHLLPEPPRPDCELVPVLGHAVIEEDPEARVPPPPARAREPGRRPGVGYPSLQRVQKGRAEGQPTAVTPALTHSRPRCSPAPSPSTSSARPEASSSASRPRSRSPAGSGRPIAACSRS